MPLRSLTQRTALLAALAGVWAPHAVAAEAGPAKDSTATVQWMIGLARAWAEQACGGRWVVSEMLADDFRGTSPKGTRYGKPAGAPEPDPKTQWSTDCRLDEADVRFFGPDVAVMYGAESKTVPLADGQSERRCLVWTDTWLRRHGQWQVIAVQDSRIDCPARPWATTKLKAMTVARGAALSENKTTFTDASVEAYIASRASPQQREDCLALTAMFERITGQPPRMFGPSIVGFGAYRYTYDSGRSGEAPLAGFAIRGRELVVYLSCDGQAQAQLLSQLGPHRMTTSCLYFKRLADLDATVLEQLVVGSIAEVRQRHG